MSKHNRKTSATPKAPVFPESYETPEVESAPKVKKAKRLTEEQLLAKYPSVVEGTLRFETEGRHIGKQTVEATLACGHVERVATSDLFQVRRCAECKKPAPKAPKAPKAEKKGIKAADYNKPTLVPSTYEETVSELVEATA